MASKRFDCGLGAYLRSGSGSTIVDTTKTRDFLADEEGFVVQVQYDMVTFEDDSREAQNHFVRVCLYDGEQQTHVRIEPSNYVLPRIIRNTYNAALKEFA